MIEGPSVDHTSLRIQGFVIGLVFGLIGLALTFFLSDAVKKGDRALGAAIGMAVEIVVFVALSA